MSAVIRNTPAVAIPDRVEWRGDPVLTSEQLAQSFGTTPQNIRQNHNRNQSRFTEGVHYYCLTGSKLNDFRLRVTDSHAQISPKTRTVYVWTKRGTARHSKILDTDTAWDVFDALERNYFERQPGAPPIALNDPAQLRGLLLSYTERAERAEEAALETARPKLETARPKLETARPKLEAHDRFLDGAGLFSVGDVARQIGTHRNALFAWMRDHGWVAKSQAVRNTPLAYAARRDWLRVRDVQCADGQWRSQTFFTVQGKDVALRLYRRGELFAGPANTAGPPLLAGGSA